MRPGVMPFVTDGDGKFLPRDVVDVPRHDVKAIGLRVAFIPDPPVRAVARPRLIEIGMSAVGQFVKPVKMQLRQDGAKPHGAATVLREIEVAIGRSTVKAPTTMTAAADDPLRCTAFR